MRYTYYNVTENQINSFWLCGFCLWQIYVPFCGDWSAFLKCPATRTLSKGVSHLHVSSYSDHSYTHTRNQVIGSNRVKATFWPKIALC